MKTVVFTKGKFRSYVVGDIAGFEDEIADQLIEDGIAEKFSKKEKEVKEDKKEKEPKK